MKLYNSYSEQIEEFTPQKAGAPVSLYVCGITPYDTTHLGHAFTYASADVLLRYLAYQGQPVRYVQNVTDIDDDILRKAAEEGDDWQTLGNRWTRHFIEDLQMLNVRAPQEFPRATETIPQIIETVQALIEAGVAYKAAGSVYFDVETWPKFGQLSHLPRDEMLPVANERGNNPDDPNKRNPLDFVLWQAKQPGEPSWASPWGEGRPGWHIECSTMASHLLGETIDIHMGGADLLFPHHECEIAQITPLTGKPFVRYWLHVGMVRKDGEKMSKSLGNLVMVNDLLERFSPNAIRLYLGLHHYREPWSYNEQALQATETLADKIANAVRATMDEDVIKSQEQSASPKPSLLDPAAVQEAFETAMNDDLNTGQAITVIERLTEQIMQATAQRKAVGGAAELLCKFCDIFGLYFGEEAPSAASWSAHLQRFPA